MARDRRRIASQGEVATKAGAPPAASAIDISLANRIEYPHPLLIALVRAMARHAARMDCAAPATGSTDD